MTGKKAGVLKAALVISGTLIGAWYVWCEAFGMFTASEREVHNPFFWIALLCPGSSLLAVLLGLGKPKLAARWLIGAGLLAAPAAMLATDSPLEMLGVAAVVFTAPMVSLGYGFLVLSWQKEPASPDLWRPM